MLRTLFLIPHDVAGLPVFGFGWLFLILLGAMALRISVSRNSESGIAGWWQGEGVSWLLISAVAVFVLPAVELTNLAGDPIGIAVRGYGVFLLLGVASGIGLAAYRASRYGLSSDIIYALAPWAFVGGIIGARVFFVVQYREQFMRDSFLETLGEMLNFTAGGMVVYGSFIGGGAAVVYYLWRNKLSVLNFGDVILPCLFIGVFFGRMGCLMNGCCYGGRCEPGMWAVQFPPQSKVYEDQVQSGEIFGLTVDEASRKITAVEPGSIAESLNIQTESIYFGAGSLEGSLAGDVENLPVSDLHYGRRLSVDQRLISVPVEEMPDRALPVRATQPISSISSLILCLALCSLSRFVSKPGVVMWSGFLSYAMLRFGLEWVRVDEAGQFGTTFSISQWVSVFVASAGALGLAFAWRRQPNVHLPVPESAH
ncbi:MAG: prolipoprotein diacylglyceryl transferase [Planctomycetota bacterium]